MIYAKAKECAWNSNGVCINPKAVRPFPGLCPKDGHVVTKENGQCMAEKE